MSIEMKIMLSAVLFLGGFLWSYLFLRQLMYNFIIAFPLIRRMNRLQSDLIAVGAKRYTLVSVIVTTLMGGVLLFLVIHFLPLYLTLSFAGGAIIAFIFIIARMKISNREMFDLFANAYSRFIPDDELRTLLYQKEYKKIKARLKEMGISGTFVPEFKS